MALNRFMHPRNIYKIPPDFAKLAKKFEDFAKIAKTDVSGRVSIDFKDPNALRVLTRCLLKSDFNLDVIIPEARLVPTLPLRLNYILWIEDMLHFIESSGPIWGIDIGTGACAIYPLLGAVKNKWHIIGTETDEESFKNATKNVQNNNLSHLIEIRKNATTKALEHLFPDENSRVYHFTMCNPPFYTSFQELWESRSPARPPPKNGFTGSPQELITEGGELQFCRTMIDESKILKDNIFFFTTMVGHKYNLKELIIDLKAEGIKHTTTEFCQGRITRWGLAWTFQDYDLSKIDPPRDKIKKKTPLIFSLPELLDTNRNFNNIVDKIKNMLQNLKLTFKIINKKQNEIILDVVALSNTWSNQRRKRRLLKKIAESEAKIAKTDKETASKEYPSTTEKVDTDTNNVEKSSNQKENKTDMDKTEGEERTPDISNFDISTNNDTPLVHMLMKLHLKCKEVFVEMEYIDGSAGKEGLHQIVQYIKNNWK